MSKPSIQPAKWQPPTPVAKPPAHNLPQLNILPVPGAGPEDALFVDDAIYTGLEDGRIVKVSFDGWQIEVVADTGGRPLGLEQHPDGILICDAEQGLLLLGPEGLTTLVAKGEHGLRVCNNAAVAADGTVYFTDSSQRFDLEHWTADIIEHSGTGRLLRRDPDGAVEVLEGLQFANGVRSPRTSPGGGADGSVLRGPRVAQGRHARAPGSPTSPPSPTTSPRATTVWCG